MSSTSAFRLVLYFVVLLHSILVMFFSFSSAIRFLLQLCGAPLPPFLLFIPLQCYFGDVSSIVSFQLSPISTISCLSLLRWARVHFVRCDKSSFLILSGHLMSRVPGKLFTNTWILFINAAVCRQVSDLYNDTHLTFEEKILNFVFNVGTCHQIY